MHKNFPTLTIPGMKLASEEGGSSMSQAPRTAIVVPEQLYDQEQVDYLRTKIEIVRQSGVSHIHLDFEKCKATSVYALSILSNALDKLAETGGSLGLHNVKPPLQEILKSIMFDLIVPLQDSKWE